MRLTMWRYLERGDADDQQAALDQMSEKVRAVAEQQAQGNVNAGAEPLDIMVLMLAMSTAWTLAAPALIGLGPDLDRLDEQRALVIATVSNLAAPGTSRRNLSADAAAPS
jgi:hypothetical protein